MSVPSRAAAIVVRRAVAADARGIATVQVLTWRATYRGIVDDAYIDGLTVEAREARWRTMLDTPPERAHDIFVAETRAGGVIGFASGGALREPALSAECDAELYAIYILPSSQRRGLGRTLVRAVARALHGREHHRMLVQVLSENAPARRFYESLGARFLLERDMPIGGAPYAESVYEFPDVRTLVAGE